MARLGYRWRLREVMAARGMFMTTELAPLLEARGITLSPAQVYRLVTQVPERLSLRVLMALCDALECTSVDLIEPTAEIVPAAKRGTGTGTGGGDGGEVRELRPKRARIVRDR
jgi:DNA-binding Xre family transcriptional regulator